MKRSVLWFSILWMLGVGSAHAGPLTNEGGIQTGAGLLTYQESGAGNGGGNNLLWFFSGEVQAPLRIADPRPFIGIRVFYAMDFAGEERWTDPMPGVRLQVNDRDVRIFWPEVRLGYRFLGPPDRRWAVDPYFFLAYRWEWFARRNFFLDGVQVAAGTVKETFELPEGGAGVRGTVRVSRRISVVLGGQYGRIAFGRVTNSSFPGIEVGTGGNRVAGNGAVSLQLDSRSALDIGYAYDQIRLISDRSDGAAFPNSRTKMSYGYVRLSTVF